MMRFVRGFVLLFIVGGGLLVLPACNSDDVAPTPIATPAPPVRGVVFSDAFTEFPLDLYFAIPIPLSQAGILDFTVDWTFTNTYMSVAFGRQSCTFPELSGNTCPFLVSTPAATTPKPRILITPALPTGTYYLYIYNKPYNRFDKTGSENTEAVSLHIGLTIGVTGSGSAAASANSLKLQPLFVKP